MLTKKLFDDAYLREFSAKVLECVPLADAAKRTDGAKYGVILDRTAFFPEGGGQSADTGALGGAVVTDVQEVDGEILHYTDVPLKIGKKVAGLLDWEQRFRKMQNHTGEHLISGIVHTQFGFDNVGFHLGKDGVTVDFSGVLTEEELAFVEYIANRVIGLNVPVTISYPSPKECAAMEYRSKLELTEDIRIVTIEGWDVCACCAPHVAATGAVGGIKLLGCESWKGGVRVKMLCGLDALEDYRKRLEQTVRISNLLSCKQLETADAVVRLMNAQQADREETAKLKRAYVACKAEAIQPTDGNIVIFDDVLDPNNLRSLVNLGVQKAGGVCAAFAGDDENGYRYIIGSANVKLRAWAKAFHAALGGRGGGSEEMIQGSVTASAAAIRGYLEESPMNS